jgi:hypothetical protein
MVRREGVVRVQNCCEMNVEVKRDEMRALVAELAHKRFSL